MMMMMMVIVIQKIQTYSLELVIEVNFKMKVKTTAIKEKKVNCE